MRKPKDSAGKPESAPPPDMADDFANLEQIALPPQANGVDADDPFANLDSIKLDQSYIDAMQTSKLITRVLVMMPKYPKYFRINPDPAFRIDTLLVALKNDDKQQDQFFFPAANMRRALAEHLKPVRLFTGITRQGTIFLFPVKLPDTDNYMSVSWANSRLEAAELCMTGWYTFKSNKEISGYEPHPASGNLPDPEWPADMKFGDLLRIAFKDLTIKDDRHLVYRELFGIL